MSENEPLNRYPVYPGQQNQDLGDISQADKIKRLSLLSYMTLFILMIVFPIMSYPWLGDPGDMLRQFAESPLFLVGLVLNAFFLWFIFAMVWGSVWLEGVKLSEIGFTRFRLIHILWAVAFWGVALLILTLIAMGLEQIGIYVPAELGMLVPKDPAGKVIWVFLSITAGFTEEAAFRGFLINRFQKIGKTTKWLVPSIIASVVFGLGHTYQGLGGFILIAIYGGMFALLYWRTKSLWPCIIAHSLQDLSHLVIPFDL